MNNFEAAGQEVFPRPPPRHSRYHTDGLKLFPQQSYKPGDREKTGEQLRQVRKRWKDDDRAGPGEFFI